jgi:hypothetical protein
MSLLFSLSRYPAVSSEYRPQRDHRAGLIDTIATDALCEAMLPLKDDDGNLIGERRTTVNRATKSCRHA